MTNPSSHYKFVCAVVVIIEANNAAIAVSLPFSGYLRILVPRVCVAQSALVTWSRYPKAPPSSSQQGKEISTNPCAGY